MARRTQIEVQGFIVYARRSSGTNLLLFAIQNEVQETNGWFRVQGLNLYRFENLNECVYAGHEGSNHSFRSEARRVLEFADAIWSICFQTIEEITATREDHLKPFEEYKNVLPDPMTPSSTS